MEIFNSASYKCTAPNFIVAFCERVFEGAMWKYTISWALNACSTISRFSSRLELPPHFARTKKVKPMAMLSGRSGGA